MLVHCLFNKFKFLEVLENIASHLHKHLIHSITLHHRYMGDWFSHFLAIYFSRNGS